MSKSQYKVKHVKGESRSQHKLRVPPCERYMSAGDTHSLCVVCLGAEQVEPQRGKLDERFLRFKTPPPHRSLPFFPDLHTEMSRSWVRPFSDRLFVPSSDYYGNVAGTSERGYRAI